MKNRILLNSKVKTTDLESDQQPSQIYLDIEISLINKIADTYKSFKITFYRIGWPPELCDIETLDRFRGLLNESDQIFNVCEKCGISQEFFPLNIVFKGQSMSRPE